MNIYEHRTGQRVITLACKHRRLAVNFPGWGAPDYADYLLPIPAGLTGTVTAVESHGSNPWTRYTVKLDDGTRIIGAIEGAEITPADPAQWV
jgi:hypothetical protein